ncbi:MAG: penicillin-binding transpeptidase domain-containing protein [Kineosporiaceae bacterium]
MRTPLVIAAAVTVVAAAGAGGAVVVHQRAEAEQDRRANAAIAALAAGWTRRDVTGVPFADPKAAAGLQTATAGLRATAVTVVPERVTRRQDRADATLKVTWSLPYGVTWRYEVPTTATKQGDRWLIAAPARGSYWHPELKPGLAMTLTRTPADRGDLLDRTGTPLMPQRPVYPVQLDPARATPDVAKRLEGLVGEKPGVLVAKLAAARRAGSKATIPVITYREQDFEVRREALDALVGVVYPKTLQPLAVTREFGQPLLGTFGEVTAEVVAASGGRLVAGDRAGLSGLLGRFDAQLAGTPGISVAVPQDPGISLFDQPAVAGTDVALTLDPRVQAAAEKALAGSGDVPSGLVAIDVATGEILASANRPAFGFDRALTGHFPPGSAFKVVSSSALLGRGLVTLTSAVSCPASFTVDGRAFRNFEGETLGSPTFRQDFQHSCNTAFVQLSRKLADDDLAKAAAALGIGAGWAKDLGVANAFDGSVPANTGATDKAAATIGQGRVLVSPAALAVMSGSVARGSYLPPRLVAADQQPAAAPLDPTMTAALRTAMRDVVTGGTATVLANTPGGPVFGKTGTAEFGSARPPKTHAWFTGYQGGVAFAVVVEQGRSGGSVAAPIAKAFLTELAARPAQ